MKNLILEQIIKIKKSKCQAKTADIAKKQQSATRSMSTVSIKTYKNMSAKMETIRPSFNIFQDLVFCFPVMDVQLSPKRIYFIAKLIQEKGGRIMDLKGLKPVQKVDYALVSRKANIQQVRKMLKGKIQCKGIIDFNFIHECIKGGYFCYLKQYSLQLYQQEGQDKEQVENTATINHPIKKRIKREHPTSQHKSELQEIETQVRSEQDKGKVYDANNKKVNKDLFLCQKGSTYESFSMNKFLCDELMKLQKIYQSEKDLGRKIAYLKAVSTIRSLNKQIQSEKDIEQLKGIGKKMMDKVKQLILTGRLTKLENLQHKQQSIVCAEFCKIWGVGPSKAQEIYNQGIRSIQQLKSNTEMLSKNQRIGLKYFDDFQARIPRDRVSKIYDSVVEGFKCLVSSIDLYQIEICGSFRRGKQTCGDIDIIITRKDGYFEKKMLLDLILKLEQIGLLTDHLSFPKPQVNQSSISYMGVCKFDDKYHRIDIKYYPFKQYAYALLYFTGSDMFNRSMRLYGTKIGLQLSDHGLVPRKQKNGVVWNKPIPFCMTEKEIFDLLGLDYKTPAERDL